MRRLPVIQDSTSDDAAAARRPSWQWILIAGGLSVTLWLPLAAVAAPLGVHLAARVVGVSPADVASGGVHLTPRDGALLGLVAAAPLLLAFGAAVWTSGALVGRFGRPAARRDAALGGLVAAAFMCLIATLVALLRGAGLPGPSIFAAFVALAAFGGPAGRLGAAFGTRRKAVLDSPE